MSNKSSYLKQDYDGLITQYGERTAKFSGAELRQRQKEYEMAYGMNRLEGAASINPLQSTILDLLITGRVSEREYLELCKLIFRQDNNPLLGFHPQG